MPVELVAIVEKFGAVPVSLTSKIVAPQRGADRLAQLDLKAHYENVAVSTVRSIVRHSLLIVGLVAVSLVTAALIVSWLPRQYTAEALVSPNFFLQEDNSKQVQLASIEGASLVNSEARLISSPAMVRAVVRRLGLDDDPDFVAPSIFGELNWVIDAILPESARKSRLEWAASRVGKRLVVTNNPRSYLISVSFTCSSPEKAAEIANAFVLEYLRAKATQRLTDAVTTKSRSLTLQSSLYGEKHPNVVRANAELRAARIRLQELATDEFASGNGLTLAEPNPTPTSPRGHVILGLALASALALGIGCAIRRDRHQTKVSVCRKNTALRRAKKISI
jgi:uncharacterized protein involved in exopolysaccharide biosynthesis